MNFAKSHIQWEKSGSLGTIYKAGDISMSKAAERLAERLNAADWSYAYAYGVLEYLAEAYLRGELDRNAFTARFAVVQMRHAAYKAEVEDARASLGSRLTPKGQAPKEEEVSDLT